MSLNLILLLVAAICWAQGASQDSQQYSSLSETDSFLSPSQAKQVENHHRRHRRFRRGRGFCPNDIAVKKVTQLQGQLEHFLSTCRFELAANYAKRNFSFSTIDFECGKGKVCAFGGNLEQFVRRFYDIDDEKRMVCNNSTTFSDTSVKTLVGYSAVDQTNVNINGIDISKVTSYNYTFHWVPVSYCQYELVYIDGNNSLLPAFIENLTPCQDCSDPLVKEVILMQDTINQCNATNPNLAFLLSTKLEIIQECPGSPGSCCVGQELPNAALLYDGACGSEVHLFGDPIRTSNTTVVSSLKAGSVGGPYINMTIIYEFNDDLVTLKQITVMPEHCYGQPQPGPCSSCLDPAIYQVVQFQKNITSCNIEARNTTIPIQRCGSCLLSPGTGCVINEGNIQWYFDLVCTSPNPNFSPYEFVDSNPGDEGVFVKTILSFGVKNIDVIFFLSKGGNGIYAIEVIRVFDGCNGGLLQGCDICPDPAVLALTKLQDAVKACTDANLVPINNFNYLKSKMCSLGGGSSCCTSFEGNKAEFYAGFCPSLSGTLSFDGPWYNIGSPGDNQAWLQTTLIYPGDVLEQWLVLVDRVDADNFKITELIRYSPNCPPALNYGACSLCTGTVIPDA